MRIGLKEEELVLPSQNKLNLEVARSFGGLENFLCGFLDVVNSFL